MSTRGERKVRISARRRDWISGWRARVYITYVIAFAVVLCPAARDVIILLTRFSSVKAPDWRAAERI